jgi:hypothetical protein
MRVFVFRIVLACSLLVSCCAEFSFADEDSRTDSSSNAKGFVCLQASLVATGHHPTPGFPICAKSKTAEPGYPSKVLNIKNKGPEFSFRPFFNL